MMPVNNYEQQHLLLTVEEAREQLHLSRPVLYSLINSGQLRSITIGRARRIPSTALEEFIADRLDGTTGAA